MCDTNTYRAGNSFAFGNEGPFFEMLSQAFSDLRCGGKSGFGQDNGELLTTDAAQVVRLTQAFERPFDDTLQNGVTDGVTMRIVDFLEMVEIDHHR